MDFMDRSRNSRFSSIAEHYNALNHIFSFWQDIYWRHTALSFCKDDKPKRILDVGTGTGDLAIELAKRFPKAQITAIDINKDMLKVAGKRGKNFKNLKFKHGNGEHIAYAKESFDLVVSGFALRNFVNLDVALQEMYRVTKDSGKLILLDMEKPIGYAIEPIIKFYFFTIIPAVGGIITGDKEAYRFLPESIWKFSEKNVNAKLQRLKHKHIARRKMFGAFVNCLVK